MFVYYAIYLVGLLTGVYYATDLELLREGYWTTGQFWILFGSTLLTLVVYMAIEFTINGHRYRSKDLMTRHAILVSFPSVLLGWIFVNLTTHWEIVTIRIFVGFCAPFATGLLFTKFMEWHTRDRPKPVAENPLDIEVEIYSKVGEDLKRILPGEVCATKEVFIKARANTYATVAILVKNKAGTPSTSYPFCKIDNEMDYLFTKGSPLQVQVTQDQDFKIWIAGSKKIGDLNQYLYSGEMAWPESIDKSFISFAVDLP